MESAALLSELPKFPGRLIKLHSLGYSQILSQEPKWIKVFLRLVGQLQFPSPEDEAKQLAFISSFIFAKRAGKASSPIPSPPQLPIQTLYGKEEEPKAASMPAQPQFSQPSHPTQQNTQHYKLWQLGASDYLYGNLLQVEKWINDYFSSWLHFENQN